MVHKPVPAKGQEIGVFDLLRAVLKNLGPIMSITFAVALITALYSLTLPRVYQGTTRFLANMKNESSAGALLSKVSGSLGLGDFLPSGMGGLTGSSELFLGIMRGPTVMNAIVDRFGLMATYHVSTREYARGRLAGIVSFVIEKKSNIISVSVNNTDPQLASAMANAFVEELSSLLRTISLTSAGRQKLFWEEQLKTAHNALAEAEEAMNSFTGMPGIYSLQTKIATKEVQLKVMQTYATSFNPDVRKAEEELRALRQQLQKMDTKGGASSGSPTESASLLGTEYVRKIREFKFQEARYDVVVKQYEAAKVTEARESESVQVIDKAMVPETAIGPKRTQIVLGAAAVAFLLVVAGTILSVYVRKSMRDPEFGETIETLKGCIPRWKVLGLVSSLYAKASVYRKERNSKKPGVSGI